MARPYGDRVDIGAYEWYLPNVTGDGIMNALDLQVVIRGALGDDTFPHDPDFNGDGITDAIDIQSVINFVLGVW